MKPTMMMLAVAALAAPAMAADISYTGGQYNQNFDGLPSTGSTTVSGSGPIALNGLLGATGMEGWYGANFMGSSASTEFRAQDGTLSGSSGRGVVSFGAAGSSERALGSLATSNQISSIGAVFVNNSGQTLTSVTISFTGEQWRRGDVSTPDVLAFTYGLSNSIANATTAFTSLNFTSPNMATDPSLENIGLNGNDAANQAAVSATITGLSWAPGTSLAIAWASQDLSGQDNGLAIDNFHFSASVPAPSAAALLGLMGVAAGRRRR